MANRKERAIALLAGHGTGVALATQKLAENLLSKNMVMAHNYSAAVFVFFVGAGFSFVALCVTDDDEKYRSFEFVAAVVMVAIVISLCGVTFLPSHVLFPED